MTDAELDAIEAWAKSEPWEGRGMTISGEWAEDRIFALVAEVRRLRALIDPMGYGQSSCKNEAEEAAKKAAKRKPAKAKPATRRR